MDVHWEQEIANLLDGLANTQQELLAHLDRKRAALVKQDHQTLMSLTVEERQLCEQLQVCQQKRQELLAKAEQSGLPADSIESLAGALPEMEGQPIGPALEKSKERSRLLRHQSVTQWVAIQRTLLHLSQLLEIIATGGRGQTTYGRGGPAESSGALMDQAA